MTSHQAHLCEAIITLCLDELKRIPKSALLFEQIPFFSIFIFFAHNIVKAYLGNFHKGEVCHTVFDYYERCTVTIHSDEKVNARFELTATTFKKQD